MNKPYCTSRFAFCLLLALLGTLSACGFHLRGSVELPPVLEVTYIESKKPYQGISPALRGELLSAGAQLTEDRSQASGVVQVLSERSQRRVLSVGSSGRASEYELFEEVKFSLLDKDGRTLLAAQTISMTRDLTFDENELLGKVTESEGLREQMLGALARQMITRILVGTREQ